MNIDNLPKGSSWGDFGLLGKFYIVKRRPQPVDVNKLVKGRPLDNMEFMQWLKFYFEGRLGCQDLDYDPVGRRCASAAALSYWRHVPQP